MMRFLVDECTGPNVAAWLRDKGYEVFSIFEDTKGISFRKPHKSTARIIRRCH